MPVTLKASRLIQNAFKRLGVIAGTETPTADMAQDALDRMNAMLGGWAIQRNTMQGLDRTTYPFVAGQGGPSNPYLIGTGLQFNQVRPTFIDDAGIVSGTGQTQQEIHCDVTIVESEYTELVLKNTPSTIPVLLYYGGASTGEIFLWPVPSSALYSLALYCPVAVSSFADYNSTSYTLYDGLQLAIETNLAIHLAPEYPRASGVDPLLLQLAAQSLAYIKRLNIDPGLLKCDSALLSGGSDTYGNWLTGP